MESMGCLKLMRAVLGQEAVESMVRQWLSQLTPRQVWVLKERFGLEDNMPPQTLEAVGRKAGVTRERIRQVERKALQKLRSLDVARC